MTLNVWAQQDYSHLAAMPAIADAFTVVFDDWARAHSAAQLRVSVMPALELHKAKLQLTRWVGRWGRHQADDNADDQRREPAHDHLAINAFVNAGPGV